MKLQDLIITEDVTVKDAIERLEMVRCKVVYVVKGKKLLASVSDGDIRRYALKGQDVNENIIKVAHYKPIAYREFELEKCRARFKVSEFFSFPLVNLNGEIIGVIFRDGTVVKERKTLDIPVVMMAGGKGTRLYPYTKILPKPLIPVGDLPISEHIIRRFYENGSNRFYLIVSYKKEMLLAYYDTIEKDYSIEFVEEKEPLGTGGGLALVKDMVDEDFFLTNCDIIIDADYSAIYQMHKEKGNFITMVLTRYTSSIPYGVVQIDGENNYEGVIEKPSYEYLINTGVYIVNPRVVRELEADVSTDFPDIIERYKRTGERIGCYIVQESAYMDMGQIEELEKMREKLNLK